MPEPSARSAPAAKIELACFELAGQTWAVPITQVREILATPAITPLPDAPDAIEGVMDLRGTLIPVVDLARMLAPETSSTGPRARTVVVEARGLVIGFRVERATQVLAAVPAEMEPLPALARDAGCRAVVCVVRREGRSPVLVVDLPVLLERFLPAAATARSGDEVAA